MDILKIGKYRVELSLHEFKARFPNVIIEKYFHKALARNVTRFRQVLNGVVENANARMR